jgi:CRP/FNR family transcriptional regulator, cyclic AMP receptor protein
MAQQRGRAADSSGHLDVLAAIPTIYRNAVLGQCERAWFPKGGTIWTQGQPAGYVAFLVSGKAMSSHQSRNGKTGTTGFWCAGDLLGAADFGDSVTRHMTVRCLERCEIYMLPYGRFQELVQRFPEVALVVIQAMSVRLRWVSQLAVTLETQSAVVRICAALQALSERFGQTCEEGVRIDLALTNEDLAAISGVSRQFTNTTLQELRASGVIRGRNRNLVVADLGALDAIVQDS